MNKGSTVNVWTIWHIDHWYNQEMHRKYITAPTPWHKEYLEYMWYPGSRRTLISILVEDILDRENKKTEI